MPYTYRTTRTSRNKPRNFGGNSRNTNKSRRKRGENIDPRRFVQRATKAETVAYVPKNQFTDFALPALLQANVDAAGFVTPSQIQDQAIPAGLEGYDVIGLAGTGTGKTAAFLLPVLTGLLTYENSKALIVAPTRELAEQIEEACRMFAKATGLRGALLIGGTSMGPQLRELRDKPEIIIGTPGRIQDHVRRGTLSLGTCNFVVLDEVDRMLDMGFVKDVTDILAETAPVRQSFFFSATMTQTVRNLIDTFSQNPVTISVGSSSASTSVHQDVVRYSTNGNKMEQLHELLIQEGVQKAIIFDETQRSVERLHEQLQERGFATVSIHGGKSQGQRKRALNQFKQNEVTVMVATDVAARGIDVADITHVINYSVPESYDDYIHRIGRAGRAEQIGYAYTFIAS